MITAEQIKILVENKLQDSDIFIVDVIVKPGNNIIILLDSNKGVSIEDCVTVSRHVESGLDREVEDFELSVMSAGLSEPLKVLKQYQKNIDKQVEVLTKEGKKLIGKLCSADDNGIVIESKSTELVAGKKTKQQIIKRAELPYSQIKTTKLVLLF